MPVRKIKKNYRSVTGVFQSFKNKCGIGYESLLERDFFLILEFDEKVKAYEEQPFTIQYERNGKNFNYTPDCLVTYHDTSIMPCVVEVKMTDELKDKKVFFEEKFNQIQNYITLNDMEFKLITELDIRSSYLENIKFLYRFAFLENIENKIDSLLKIAQQYEQISVNELLKIIDSNRYVQAEYLGTIWHLVFTNKFELNMNSPINNNSILRINHE